MKIEKMSFSDLKDVTTLASQLGYTTSFEDIDLRFQKMQNKSDYGLFVARSNAGKVVGYIQVNIETYSLLNEDDINISALVVDESVRNQGIGAALLAHAEQWTREKQITLIRLRSNVKREDAHRFYKRQGYGIKKSWHLFTKDLK